MSRTMEHRCQYDVSCWPSHAFFVMFDEDRCCGRIAHFTITMETLCDAELHVWACAEHYDEWIKMEESGLPAGV